MGKKSDSSELIELRLKWNERCRIARFAHYSFSFDLPKSAASPLWLRANRNPTIVPQRVRDAILQVGAHDGPDALILRNAIVVPWRARLARRREIINECNTKSWEQSRFNGLVYRAMRQITVLMASLSYHTLVQCYHEQPNYIFRAKPQEDYSPDQLGYPHKLPAEPATISPELPLSPAIFGLQRSQFGGGFTPDIVAFVMLECRQYWRRSRELGPRLYFLEDIEAELPPAILDTLRERDFTIQPDSSVGVCPRRDADAPSANPFGTARGINLFGKRELTSHRYMRFSLEAGRLSSANQDLHDRQQHINELHEATSRLRTAGRAPRVTLGRGDVLLVNNRRVATHWTEKCKRGLFVFKEHNLKKGDRLVFQMNFYFPHEVAARPRNVAEAVHDI